MTPKLTPRINETTALLDQTDNSVQSPEQSSKLFDQKFISNINLCFTLALTNSILNDEPELNDVTFENLIEVLKNIEKVPSNASMITINNTQYKPTVTLALSLCNHLIHLHQKNSKASAHGFRIIRNQISTKILESKNADFGVARSDLTAWKSKQRTDRYDLAKTNGILFAYSFFIIPLTIINLAMELVFGCNTTEWVTDKKIENSKPQDKTSKQYSIGRPLTSISNLWKRRHYLLQESHRIQDGTALIPVAAH